MSLCRPRYTRVCEDAKAHAAPIRHRVRAYGEIRAAPSRTGRRTGRGARGGPPAPRRRRKVVAAAESDPGLKELFAKLAAEGEEQAAIIAREFDIKAAFSPSLRARTVRRLVALFGARRMKGVLAAMKVRGLSAYSGKLRPGMLMSVEVINRARRSLSVPEVSVRSWRPCNRRMVPLSPTMIASPP